MSQRKALNALVRGVNEKKGFLVLTGDVGTGKTTLSRTLLKMLDRKIATALVLNSDLSEEEILKAVLMDFGLAVEGMSKFDLMEGLYRYLVKRTNLGRTTLIVVDDAQNLPPRSLEQIRMISNFETDKEKLIQILLVGQPELDEKLNSHKFRQINQRIAVREHLEPLLPVETVTYVRQRLTRVGGDAASGIFSHQALKVVHRETGGYPRTVNTLCDHVLTEARRMQRRTIDPPMVRGTARAIGLEKARRARLKGRLKAFKWHAAASLAAVAATAAIVSVLFSAPPPTPDLRLSAAWERRFSTMERSLFAVEQKLSGTGTPVPGTLTSGTSAGALENGRGEATGDAAKTQEEYRKKEAELRKEAQRKAREVRRIEEESEGLRKQLQEKLIENEAMAQELSRRDLKLSGVEPAPRNPDVNLAIIEQLRVENSELAERQEAMKRVASTTFQVQSKQIERLNLERKKLLQALRKLKAIEDPEKTTMLSVGPQ
jgi:general secretion pathway protein A